MDSITCIQKLLSSNILRWQSGANYSLVTDKFELKLNNYFQRVNYYNLMLSFIASINESPSFSHANQHAFWNPAKGDFRTRGHRRNSFYLPFLPANSFWVGVFLVQDFASTTYCDCLAREVNTRSQSVLQKTIIS